MKVNGSTIIWKVWAFIFGMMADSIKANTKTIKSMVSASTPGQMAAAMKDTGTVANSMAWARTWSQKTTK